MKLVTTTYFAGGKYDSFVLSSQASVNFTSACANVSLFPNLIKYCFFVASIIYDFIVFFIKYILIIFTNFLEIGHPLTG